jgi:UDPglucose 6-dehydrogenase
VESRVLREGFPVEDTLRPDRIVMGVATDSAEKLMRAVYEQILEAGTR